MSRSDRAQWKAFLQGGKGGSTARAAGAPARAAGADSQLTVRKNRLEGVVLGADPSLRGTGLALVERTGERFGLIASQTVTIGRKPSPAECLGLIAAAVEAMLARAEVTALAVEASVMVQNIRVALALGSARGAVITPASLRHIAVAEYPPTRIKQAITGQGRASKVQVQGMVRQLLGLPTPLPPDEADAAAAALCHFFTGEP